MISMVSEVYSYACNMRLSMHLKLMIRCKHCGEILEKIRDKVFCSDYCRSAFQYQQNKDKEGSLYQQIDEQLKRNRRILKLYNKAGKATLRKSLLINEGFNPNYFTQFWKNGQGEVYLLVYEFGFLKVKDKSGEKYLLVKWQDYMNSKMT